MTTYRLFPSTSGPSTPITYSGNFIAGVVFAVKPGAWLKGYYVWCCASGQPTGSTKAALWQVGQFNHVNSQQLVPNSIATISSLTPGQWNYIPLPTPIQLAPNYDPTSPANGGAYIVAISINGNFPDTSGFWTSAISNGPLVAYSQSVMPYSMNAQGVFSSTGTADPAVTCPLSASGTDNFWVDVEIDNQPPSGYARTYRLWPGKYDANAITGTDDNRAYNIDTEIWVTSPVVCNYIWYFLPDGASATAGLATAAGIWNNATQTKVVDLSSPSWTTASGGPVTIGTNGQWIKAALPSGTTLSPGHYRVAVYNANGTLGVWGSKDAGSGYWGTGVGSNDIVWGPLKAPSQAHADLALPYPGSGTVNTGGQPSFAYSGSNDFPAYTTGNNPYQNYWIDLEVTPVTTTQPATVSMSGTGFFLLGAARGIIRFSGSGSFAVSPKATYFRGLVLQGSGSFLAQHTGIQHGIVSFTGSGSFAGTAANVTKHGTDTFHGSGSFLPSDPPTGDTRQALHLAATVVHGNTLGITIARYTVNSTVQIPDPYNSTVTVVDPYTTTLAEWTMQEVDITLAEFNDETLNLAITSSGSPVNLTGLELDMFLKPARGAADNAANVVKLSTVTGEIVITNAALGQATVSIPSADLQTTGTTFYRIDIVNAGKRNTAAYGVVNTTQL